MSTRKQDKKKKKMQRSKSGMIHAPQKRIARPCTAADNLKPPIPLIRRKSSGSNGSSGSKWIPVKVRNPSLSRVSWCCFLYQLPKQGTQ